MHQAFHFFQTAGLDYIACAFDIDSMSLLIITPFQRNRCRQMKNNVSALNDLLYEDPRWKDFTTKGATWLRRLVKVISFQICDMKDLDVAESMADFCIVMKNIDGIPFIKATKVSTAGWVPYQSPLASPT